MCLGVLFTLFRTLLLVVVTRQTGITLIQVQGDYKWKLLCRRVVCCEIAGYFCVPCCGYLEVAFYVGAPREYDALETATAR